MQLVNETLNPVGDPARTARAGYRTIWRWHFYAGLFCLPFITWLSITGSIYVFKPQIEAWLDRPYNHLPVTGPRATGEAHVKAALAAVPGAYLHDYELPEADDSAVRVIVGKGTEEFRVYVHPATLQILNIANEDQRFMKRVFRLHGELMAGDRGSMLVELAASWTIVMILTGLYLWWPRQPFQPTGTVYPRLRQGGRIFWRDLHSVTGLWISFFVLFLLVSGLPWAKNWGSYLKKVRKFSTADAKIDWPTGRAFELAERAAKNPAPATGGGEHSVHGGHRAVVASLSYEPVDRIVATVGALHLAPPVLIAPPTKQGGNWTARSDAGNRTLRATLELDAATGAALKRQNFEQRPWIDRAVGIGVAAHEGQLFPLNQLVNILTALGLNLLNISAVAMWWKRRPRGVLGAPAALRQGTISNWWLLPVILLGVLLPLLGVTMVLLFLAERLLLRHIPAASRWLGLGTSA